MGFYMMKKLSDIQIVILICVLALLVSVCLDPLLHTGGNGGQEGTSLVSTEPSGESPIPGASTEPCAEGEETRPSFDPTQSAENTVSTQPSHATESTSPEATTEPLESTEPHETTEPQETTEPSLETDSPEASEPEQSTIPDGSTEPTGETEPPESTEPEPTVSNDPLYGKTAVFLGDSICAASSIGEGHPLNRYGWAGLIGEANAMNWGNYGRNGAVVTDIPDQRVIAWQVDAALASHPYADFVLFEGGCNDADQLDHDPANLGEISADYSNFDTTTFTGAFEALIARIRAAYPDAKLGYIIPPKMGTYHADFATCNYRQYYDRAIQVCRKWGVAYVDLWNGSALDPTNTAYYDPALSADENRAAGKCYIDGQHLTITGYERIVGQIEEFMRGL